MRSLHRRGFEFLLACLPGNRAFANGMGDAYKVTPQALVVRPREYSDWTRMLGISGELDVYDLTQEMCIRDRAWTAWPRSSLATSTNRESAASRAKLGVNALPASGKE